MRDLATRARIEQFLTALGREAQEPGRVYVTGGATAVLFGWRESTVDVDIKLVPDQDSVLRAIQRLKEELQLNVELASPDQFIPVNPSWEDRSVFIAQHGRLSVLHYDLCAQALSKIERGHDRDIADVEAMLARGLVDRQQLRAYFFVIAPDVYRYPALNAAAFARKVWAVTDL